MVKLQNRQNEISKNFVVSERVFLAQIASVARFAFALLCREAQEGIRTLT